MSEKCETCGKPATKTCGIDFQPMLNFCGPCYDEHVKEAHSGVAQPVERKGKR